LRTFHKWMNFDFDQFENPKDWFLAHDHSASFCACVYENLWEYTFIYNEHIL
jgi:hypothetical protein